MYLGIDIGSLTTKAVLLEEGGTKVASLVRPSGFDHRKTAEEIARDVLIQAGRTHGEVKRTVGTGYGRTNIPFADRAITEITCHARGAAGVYPEGRMVVDIGGQDSKVMSIGRGGKVQDFVMNDRCAAGTGRFLEVMARCLEVPLEEMGTMALEATRAARISNVCTVFAESEVISLIASGVERRNIICGLCQAISERIHAMIGRIGKTGPIVMTGGVALNRGVVIALEQKLGIGVNVPHEPQITGALGAALLAMETG